MSYQGQTWVDRVALPLLKNGGELLVMLRVANHAGNGPSMMSGCYASAETLAAECLMGRSTVLKHLAELTRRRLLIPGDPGLVSHIRADRRPPVYDLAGAHSTYCLGGHTFTVQCPVVTGARSEHPLPTGAQIEHPSPKKKTPAKKTRSAGARFEHPSIEPPSTGAQNDAPRVLKSSTKSSKELKESLSGAPGVTEVVANDCAEGARCDERESQAAPKHYQQAVPSHREVTGDAVADALAAQWREAHGTSPARKALAEIAEEAGEALADGDNPEWLLGAVVPFMVSRKYLELGRAKTHRLCPAPVAARAGVPVPRTAGPVSPCPRHRDVEAAVCRPCNELAAEQDSARRAKEAKRRSPSEPTRGLPATLAQLLASKTN